MQKSFHQVLLAASILGLGTLVSAQPDPGGGSDCYAPRVLAWETSPLGADCSTYTRCPLAIACSTGGTAHAPPGGFVFSPSMCETWIGGVSDGPGGCTGGTRVPNGGFPNPNPIPVQACGTPNCTSGGGVE